MYDEVDEETYRRIVGERRQREDFVVDDGEYLPSHGLSFRYGIVSPQMGWATMTMAKNTSASSRTCTSRCPRKRRL